MLRCCSSVSTVVSACMCDVGVVCVQPVAMRKALFCIICSLLSCVLEMIGAQAALA